MVIFFLSLADCHVYLADFFSDSPLPDELLFVTPTFTIGRNTFVGEAGLDTEDDAAIQFGTVAMDTIPEGLPAKAGRHQLA